MASKVEDQLFAQVTTLLKTNPHLGKLINIDALDGSGNSTQASRLVSYLENRLGKVLLTKEPTEGKIGTRIREVLQKKWELSALPLQLLFSADRGHHLDEEIIPALKDGTWVVTDRYALSTLAFGTAHGIPAWQLLAMNVYYPWPNLVVVLDVPAEECARRIARGRGEKELFEATKTLKRVRKAYLALSKTLPNIELVDGVGSEEEVFARVRSAVEDNLQFM
ncbi:dTMP kinase [Candidatus Saccharibacteria bacterium]|nr:dTMP kinase [Candidatus Saccharibacteria bacterium]